MQFLDASQILRKNFEAAGQGQVFRFFDELSSAEQRSLLEQASSIDLNELTDLVRLHLKEDGAEKVDFDQLEPAPYVALPKGDDESLKARWDEAKAAGVKALRAGQVAAFTVAGGQGTRLGYDGPKGTFATSPVANKSLFQIFAEKLARSAEIYSRPIPWFIMTSRINHEATVGFFDQHGFFGLDPASVHFFSQGLMPSVDPDGKIILASKSEIAMSPDGHGGALRALVRSGATDRMERERIKHISYFQVDNPLVRCIDPAFIGFHILEKSELSSKMTPKAYPGEKVGHFCIYKNKHVVIEYSDLPKRLAEATTSEGALQFIAGSIAIHIFDLGFVKRLGAVESEVKLPFHRADKKIKCIDAAGKMIDPDSPNGVKFEMFVFDALPLAQRPIIIETAREDDFSPVKNATGVDSVETCQADLMRLYARWMKGAGEAIEVDDKGFPLTSFEISFRFAADATDFAQRWSQTNPKPTIRAGAVIEP